MRVSMKHLNMSLAQAGGSARVRLFAATAMGILLQIMPAGSARALPSSPTLAHIGTGGTASFELGASSGTGGGSAGLTVTTTAERAVVDWQSFNIGADESVTFTMPSSRSIVVNRVFSSSCLAICSGPSYINGALQSNGNVWILDPNGVIFGSDARIDVGGLLASPALLLDPASFVNAELGAPISFAAPAVDYDPASGVVAGTAYPYGSVTVYDGAQIQVRGGPAMFVAVGGVGLSSLRIQGSVTGAGTTNQQDSSQILYGLAQSFTIRLSQTPPSALSSSDLQLFDFVVDSAAPLIYPDLTNASFNMLTIERTAVTRAGQILVESSVIADPVSGLTPVVSILSSLDATGDDRPDFSASSDGGLDFSHAMSINAGGNGSLQLFRTGVLGATGDFILDPLLEISSGGSIDIRANYVSAGTVNVFSDGTVEVPTAPHAGVKFNTDYGKITANYLDVYNSSLTNIDADVNNIVYTAEYGDISAGNINANTNAYFNSQNGAVSLGDVAVVEGNLTISSPVGAVSVGEITSGGGAYVNGYSQVTVGSVDAVSDLYVVSVNDVVTTGNIDGGTGYTQVTGNLDVLTGNVSGDGLSVALYSNLGKVTSGSVTSTIGEIQISGYLGINTKAISAHTSAFITSVDGSITTKDINADYLSIYAFSDADVGSVTAGSVGLTSNGTVVAGSINASADFVSILGDMGVSIGSVTSANNAFIYSNYGAVTAGSILAINGSAYLNANNDITVPYIKAAGSIGLGSANGNIDVGDVFSGSSFYAYGNKDVRMGAISANYGGYINSLLGSIVTGNIYAPNGKIILDGALGVSTGNIDVYGVGDYTPSPFSEGPPSDYVPPAAVLIYSEQGPVTTGNIHVEAGSIDVIANQGSVSLGSIQAQRLLVSASGGGSVLITGDVDLSPAAIDASKSGYELGIGAAGSITLNGAVTSVHDVALNAGGVVNIASGITVLDALGPDSINDAGNVNGEENNRVFGGISIRASDLVLTGPLVVTGNGGINIVSATGTGIRLGDFSDAPASSVMSISAAEFAKMTARTVSVLGNITIDGGGDVQVGNLAINGNAVGELTLTTGTGGAVQIAGTVTGANSPSIRIGSAALTPGSVKITGSLGTLAAPVGTTRIASAGDILIGSSAFVDLVQAADNKLTLNLETVNPRLGGVTPGQIFLSSGVTSLDAQGVILQQNTGGVNGSGVRFSVSGETGSPVLASTTPQRVALFGTIVDANASPVSGVAAATVSGLVAPSVPVNSAYELNGCVIASTAPCSGTVDVVAVVDVITAVSHISPLAAQPPLPPPPPPTDTSVSSGSGSGDTGSEPKPSSETPSESGSPPAKNDSQTASGPKSKAANDDGVPVEAAQPESRAGPIVVDASARDLLNPESGRVSRESGVGASNEDLWPEGH